ncbi:AAA-type ATPase family protein [Raphanus sativus]|uniref:Probable inactive ATP-dependent zinc metalloprotease FTSHI 2, chloroplastic n=1 Tax=Raphanus sativus TaxID=3726 RepID=A0A6J0P2W6_RAPSA|nr:probable inactive ATP-dependent zinc metalloprotease FTSHI 2, chloroplastic [Raphanus sativus]KAJ4893766.1 AAA-type ATPase family protein [Raphanus sativus]
MAYRFPLHSSPHFLSPSTPRLPRNHTSISCQNTSSTTHDSSHDPQDDEDENPQTNQINLLAAIPITLTLISASLPQPSLAASSATKKNRSQQQKKKKPQEALTPEQLRSWSKDLPSISKRIPYTDLLTLKSQGKLKHVIKPPSLTLRQKPEPVLVVLEDSQHVLRTVLPSLDGNKRFWEQWDELKIDSNCINAYSPPVKKPPVPSPYLGFLWRFPSYMLTTFARPKKESKRAAELRSMREDFKRQRKEEMERMEEEREAMEKAIKAQKKLQERKKRRAVRKKRYEESLEEARLKYRSMGLMWAGLAQDPNVATALGLFFFYIFYRVVVLNYKKQKKDYDDRLKIEKAEAEERKKMRELEREMRGIEVGDDEDEEGEEGGSSGGGGEKNPYLQMAKQFMKSGARVRRASSNRRMPEYLERGVDVKFTDVAGLGKIRLELEEIVKFFTHGEMYRRRGVKIPGGILLCGPPGVGKTLLAKAVAGEAGVNFFSISASQFVEIYVGVGASRVRALYQEARDNAPSVVFIDELDAVGRERGLIKGSGGQERDATLNQLLVSLDGFEGRGEVITIASTNRPDILDPALVRPGRFDRKIFIPKPGLIGRMEILQVHARKKPMAEDLDYMAVASMTDGMVGAELANIVEIAAINMMRDGRTELTTDDLLQAAQIEERGMLDRKDRSSETWRQVAINEAAMAVVAVNFPDLKNIEFLTINPRAGRELGYVRVKMDHIKFNEGMLSRQSLLDHITVQLAPRAADELWYGEDQLSTIWAETSDNARSAARSLVLGGLSEKHHGLNNFWMTDRINDIDVEALRILNMCYDRAKEILQKNRTLMDEVVEKLVQKKSLSKQEFFTLVEIYGSIEPMPPSILELRKIKRLQLQEAVMKQDMTTARNSS